MSSRRYLVVDMIVDGAYEQSPLRAFLPTYTFQITGRDPHSRSSTLGEPTYPLPTRPHHLLRTPLDIRRLLRSLHSRRFHRLFIRLLPIPICRHVEE